MIRYFEPPHPLEPETEFQWPAALGAGLIAGVILLVVPLGSPWSGMTYVAPAVMGRQIPASLGMSMFTTYLLHMALAVGYGLVISWVTSSVTRLWAVLVGGLAGLLLYLVNLGAVSVWF